MPERTPLTDHDAMTELEFRSSCDGSLLVDTSERTNCELVLDGMYQQSNGNFLEYISVYGAASNRVLAELLHSPRVHDARIVTEKSDWSLIELLVTGAPRFAVTVADSRAVPRRISANRGVGRVVVEVPPGGDSQRVIEVFRERHPDAELTARRERRVGPLFSDQVFRDWILGELTEKQRKALVTAYDEGYFDQPRRTTAEDCARSIGISQSTFSQHLRVSLRKVLTALLSEGFDDEPSNTE